MEWTNSLALELLDLYQRHAILWDTTLKDHRDRHKRKDAYKDIACHLGRSPEDVETKINRLRSQYNRELSKEKHYESCGAIYKSRWFAFDIMANLMANADCSANIRVTDFYIKLIILNGPQCDVMRVIFLLLYLLLNMVHVF